MYVRAVGLALLALAGIFAAMPIAAGQQTINIRGLDEETQGIMPYVFSIENATHKLAAGSFSTYDSSDMGSSWESSGTINSGCDYDTSTFITIQCTDADSCSSGDAAEQFEYYCYVAVPFYSDNYGVDAKFNLTMRGWSTNDKSYEFAVQDIDTSSFDVVYDSVIADNSGSPQTIRLGEVTNTGGKYGRNGVAYVRVRRSPTGTTATGESLILYELWGHLGSVSSSTLISNTISRDTGTSTGSGGVPLGDVTVTSSSDQYQTQNDYPDRYRYITTTDSGSQDIDLYLLKSSSGSAVTFTTFSGVDVVSDILITAQRNLNGSYLTVAQATTDDSGSGSLFLRTNSDHQVIFSGAGLISKTLTVNPAAQLAYSVFMQSAAAVQFQTLFAGVYYQFAPPAGTIQAASGIPGSINLTMIAANSDLASWGFNVTLARTNGSSTFLFTSVSSEASGGFLSRVIPAAVWSNTSQFDRLQVDAYIEQVGGDPVGFGRNYTIFLSTPNATSLFGTLQNLRSTGGLQDIHASLLAVFFSIAAAAGLNIRPGVGTYGGGLVVLAIMSVFAFIGFIGLELWLLMLFAVLAVYFLKSVT